MNSFRFLQVKTKAGRTLVINVDYVTRVTQVWEQCEPNAPGAEQFVDRNATELRWSRPIPELSKLHFTEGTGNPIEIQLPFAHVQGFLNGHGAP